MEDVLLAGFGTDRLDDIWWRCLDESSVQHVIGCLLGGRGVLALLEKVLEDVDGAAGGLELLLHSLRLDVVALAFFCLLL